jgi:gliding motility associated protien GldN
MFLKKRLVAAFLLLGGAMSYAQSEKTEITTTPLDGVVDKKLMQQRATLAYDNIREGDILWEKKVWRVVDIREKMNLPFAYAEMPFFTLLNEAAKSGKITAYSTESDKFTHPLSLNEVKSVTIKFDTIVTFDPVTYEEITKIVQNDLNPENVKQFRIKELWYMDKETSTLNVRILGIAPIVDEYDSEGNFKYTKPLYWIYYPQCREFLSHQQAFNFAGNDAAPTSWEDLLEQRFFSSYITKESNVYDRRIEDYLTGADALMEGDKIKNDIFHIEHDMWSY